MIKERTIIGYSFAAISCSIIFVLYKTYGMYYFTDIVKLSNLQAAFLMSTGVIWGAFSDIIVGNISDRCNSRFGKRRPFLIGAMLPAGIFVFLFFTDFNIFPLFNTLYFVFIVLLYITMTSFIRIPHLSLGSEITHNNSEKKTIYAWRSIAVQIGSLIGVPLPLILISIYSGYTNIPKSIWSFMGLTMGIITIPPILITWLSTRGKEVASEVSRQSMLDIFKVIASDKKYRYTILAYSLGVSAATLSGSSGLYYLKHAIHLSDLNIALIFTLVIIVSILAAPLVNMIYKRCSARITWLFFSMIWGLGQFLIIQYYVSADNYKLLYLLVAITGSGITAMLILGWCLISECIETKFKLTLCMQSGIYFGGALLLEKVFSAVIFLSLGIAMNFMSYKLQTHFSAETILGLKLTYGFGVSCLIFISTFFFILATRDNEYN